MRPTFQGRELRVEAHAIDWTGDLYSRRVELSFGTRLRGERRFESVDALRAQIAADVDEGRRRLAAS
jgi:riboflavin kinase/FMN adenylyltransferase